MDKTESLQIGHSSDKGNDFKIEQEVTNNRNIEVPFSHRHFFYAVYWIQEGNGIHTIDFEEYEIKPGRIFFIRPEQVHFLHTYTPIKYSALQFTEDFMLCPQATYKVSEKEISVCKDLSETEKERFSVLFRQIYTESVSGLNNATALIRSEINTLLLELERISLNDKGHPNIPDLIIRYKNLIDKQFIYMRQVRDYAMKLGVSPNYLNVMTQKHLGKSALALINERVILEAKRLLLRTDHDISEIAYRLGFNELSYFSRFCRHQMGMSPLRFREKMNEIYQK